MGGSYSCADQNDNCVLTYIIGMFSKYAWSKPLKKKTGVGVAKTFKEILKDTIRVDSKSPKL